jgi:hypothetical protein
VWLCVVCFTAPMPAHSRCAYIFVRLVHGYILLFVDIRRSTTELALTAVITIRGWNSPGRNCLQMTALLVLPPRVSCRRLVVTSCAYSTLVLLPVQSAPFSGLHEQLFQSSLLQFQLPLLYSPSPKLQLQVLVPLKNAPQYRCCCKSSHRATGTGHQKS